MTEPLLSIRNLTVTVGESENAKTLVSRVGLEIAPLGITALVGGSGSGKTTTGLSILKLLPRGLIIKSGDIDFCGEGLLYLPPQHLREIRGGKIGMVFQEPLDAFNPVFSIGFQINEVLEAHTDLKSAQRQQRILELLNMVGLPKPAQIAASYPHQLSGGMRQRAMIAQAIAADPKLIIADEPTSNLDVTLQAHIIELFKKLRKELQLSILLITHDLGMVAHMADMIAVMQRGTIVEHGTAQDVLNNPQHHYTQQLMEALL